MQLIYKSNHMKKVITLLSLALIVFTVNAQSTLKPILHKQNSINQLKKQLFIGLQNASNKKAKTSLDSSETFRYLNHDGKIIDSSLSAVRYFTFNTNNQLTNDESYEVDAQLEGDERKSYEYGTNSFAEIDYIWDDFDRIWVKTDKEEISYKLTNGDTLFTLSTYYWDVIESEWVGIESNTLFDLTNTNGTARITQKNIWNTTSKDWEYSTKDSTFTNDKGNLTDKVSFIYNNNDWEITEEIMYENEYLTNGNRKKVSTLVKDAGKFIVQDSSVFEYLADTLLSKISFYNEFDGGIFSLRSYAEGVFNTDNTEYTRTYYTKDSLTGTYYPYTETKYQLNSNFNIIGVENFDFVGNYGIDKYTYEIKDTLYIEIKYQWDYDNSEWILKEKNEFVTNTKGYYTYNAYYSWNNNKAEWYGINLKTYHFLSNDETLKTYTEYIWDYNTSSWLVDADQTQHFDNDGDLIKINYREYYPDFSRWEALKVEIFYYDEIITSTDFNNDASLDIYPNPAKEFIQINSNFLPQTVVVYNLDGKIEIQVSNSNKINIAQLPAGIYFIQAISNNQISTSKFIKE